MLSTIGSGSFRLSLETAGPFLTFFAEGRALAVALASTSCAGRSLPGRRLTVNWLRGPPFVFKLIQFLTEFEKLGNPGWNWDNYERHLAKTEGYVSM